MWELSKTFHFEAGHVLTRHCGKCSIPHGHSYEATIFLSSNKLETEGSSTNMVMDFQDLNEIVAPMVKEFLDHRWLNDSLKCDHPTAEFIAQWIFNHLKPQLPLLKKVTLQETKSCRVTYSEG